jgi:hypothetical protein
MPSNTTSLTGRGWRIVVQMQRDGRTANKSTSFERLIKAELYVEADGLVGTALFA